MEKQELAEQWIEQALRQGRWGLLERLPAERILAEELGINRGTLRAALRSLTGRGIVETLRGSGTIVRAIPHEDLQRTAEPIRHSMEAFRLFMPAVVEACVGRITPMHVLDLERILPAVGLALRNDDMRGFVQAQIRFFTGLVRTMGNPVISGAAGRVLPDARFLVRLLQRCTQQDHEELFAALARLLGALRHADTDGAVNATDVYASTLLTLLERNL